MKELKLRPFLRNAEIVGILASKSEAFRWLQRGFIWWGRGRLPGGGDFFAFMIVSGAALACAYGVAPAACFSDADVAITAALACAYGVPPAASFFSIEEKNEAKKF